ncbi:hypothetical protein LWX53_11450, partial [bacterium]|nr:hypothetical protein [bacterium]
MNIDADRARAKEGGPSADASYKSKPFVTILDDSAAAKKRPRKPTSPPTRRRGPALRKSGTILRSYADEGVETAAATVASIGASASKSILSLPAKLAAGAAGTRAALARAIEARRAAADGKNAAEASAPVETPAEAPAACPAEIAAPDGTPQATEKTPGQRTEFAIAEGAKALAGRIRAFRPRSLRAPKLVLSSLIAVLALTAAAAAIIDARRFPIGASNILLPDEDSAQAALMAYLEP